MSIGKLALRERKNRGVIKLLARGLEVTPQTIQRWKRLAKKAEPPKQGRPRLSRETRESIKLQVKIELERQGYPGWRPISHALPALSVRYVQKYVAELKREHSKRARVRIEARRVSTEVLAREAVWAIDGTHLGRVRDKPIDGQIVKDLGSLSYRSVRTGPPAKAPDVIKTIEAGGILPLVISSDNGSAYCSEEAKAWMESRQIVHLRSLPRTPQHNGAMEVGIRQLKELSKGHETLYEAACLINHNRHRGSKAYKTSAVLDAELPVAYHKVDRAMFYEKCMKRLSEVRSRSMNWREKRMQEREVIYATLEEYELIRRTGGGV